ncbi:MAG: GTP pyrophosphokinase family protein [Lachnospiraceae bacterium]|nr:GTP pyrophosphokinase family protein [Lachnospiraceae bacterium]
MLDNTEAFLKLMSHYECAMMEVETKLKVLNSEFSLLYERNPIETIKSRLKKPASILEKLKRKGFPQSVESIEENLFDIAGIRVICSFPEDIYATAELLTQQDDIHVIERKDYIAHPKENGYRSLHLIIEVPIFLSTGKKFMKVEVQFRTIAMDFWASLDHKLKYKKNLENADYIALKLKECADIISSMDRKMQEIRSMIDLQAYPPELVESNESDDDDVYGDIYDDADLDFGVEFDYERDDGMSI